VLDPRRELAELSAALRAEMEREQGMGRLRVGRPAPDALPPRPAAAPPLSDPKGTAVPRPDPTPSLSGTDAPGPGREPARGRAKRLPKLDLETEPADYAGRMTALNALGEEASGCVRCGLCKGRQNVVFGTGRARTRIMFIGEAPGADEDREGKPFVGRAGKLLDQIIDAVGLAREEVYIANILKCRPPRNRDPQPEEIAACTPYLERQIELIQPRIICALGRFAGQFLTGQPKATMAGLRGKIAYYKDRIMVLPIYHPAALLRNPNLKRVVWEDVQLLRKEYERQP
jgi:DNA polymerase